MNRCIRKARALSCVLLAGLAGGSIGCEVFDELESAVATLDAEPATLPTPEATDRFNDPLAVSALRENSIDMLVAFAADSRAELRAQALEALAPTPARLEPLASDGLRDPNPGVRSAAAMMIGRAKLSKLSASLRPLLRDQSPFVLASAVYALNRTGQDVNPTELGQMVLHERDPRVRSHAAFLIGELGDRSAIGMLKDAARDSIPRASAAEVKIFQIQLAEAMVKLGDEGQLEVIRAALYPSGLEDLEITALAVQIIGQLRDKGATDELIYLTAYKDSGGNRMPAEIRLGAAAALARVGLPRGSFIADEFLASPTPALRAQAAYVYGEIGRHEDLAKLETLLGDADPRVRLAAAAAVLKSTSRVAPRPQAMTP